MVILFLQHFHRHQNHKYIFFCRFEENQIILKNIIIIILSSILFFGCKKENARLFNSNKNLNNLLSLAERSTNQTYKLKTADSVLKIIEHNKLDSISRNQYMTLTRIYLSLNNLNYLKICKTLISNPSKPINHKEISFTNFVMANYYYNVGDYDSSYLHLTKSEKSFLKINNIDYLGYTLNTKANILTFKKDFVGAEKLSVSALKIARKNKNDLLAYHCYITLANSLSGLNNSDKAIEYYQKAFNASKNLKSDPNYLTYKLQPLNYISIIYQNQKKYAQALQSANNALTLIDNKNKEILLYSYLTNNLAYSKFKLGDKSSLNQFQETLKIGDSIKSIPIIITSKTYLGEYYLTEKDTLKANFYLKDAQLQAHKNNIYEDELKILQLLTEANPVKESFYNNRYIQLNDSLQNVERATRDKFARIEFETEEITQENKIIFKKNTDLYNSLWFIIGISILSLMLFYLLYKNKIQKAKNREMLLIQQQQEAEIRELNLLQEQKIAEEEIYQLIIAQQNKYEEGKNSEKERMSLELHDNILSSLGGLNSNLEAQMIKLGLVNNIQFNKILNGLLNVQNDARKIAHDLIKNIFINNSESFIDVVTELTTNIKNHTAIHFNVEATTTVNWEVVNNTVKINLYRIIQEALHNIEKYAQAKNVTVFIDQQDNTLELAIIDDGKGFDSTTNKEGVGLRNMKTRTDSLNGFIIITSEVKKGTKINLTVPI